MLTVNMNDRCTVTLTAAGAEMYNAWDRRTRYPGYVPKNVECGHVLREQLWTLFQIFGDRIYLGMPEVPFVNNTILMSDK